jgi:hypothetical protein
LFTCTFSSIDWSVQLQFQWFVCIRSDLQSYIQHCKTTSLAKQNNHVQEVRQLWSDATFKHGNSKCICSRNIILVASSFSSQPTQPTGNTLILLEIHSFLRATLCKLIYESYGSLQNKW